MSANISTESCASTTQKQASVSCLHKAVEKKTKSDEKLMLSHYDQHFQD